MPGKKPIKTRPLPSVKRSVFWAVGFYAWDVLVSGLPVIGLSISFLACVGYAFFALVRRVRQENDIARRYALRGLVYLAAVAAIVSSHGLNLKMGAGNAERIIAAVEMYHQDYGRFPESLEALVPQYLDRVPHSAIRLSANKFRYWSEADRHQLMWIKVPPYLRAFYDFESNKWTIID